VYRTTLVTSAAVVSTPRLDNINYQTNGEIINALIKQKTATSVDILVCDHSNMLVNGLPSPEFLDDKLFNLLPLPLSLPLILDLDLSLCDK
jgi:hypothetical protein